MKAAERWGTVERAGRAGLRAGGVAARAGLGSVIPRWIDSMPRAAPGRLPETRREGAAAVYLPACINRMFGASAEQRWVVDALVQVSARAGKPVWIPPDVAGELLRNAHDVEGLCARGGAHEVEARGGAWSGGRRAVSSR